MLFTPGVSEQCEFSPGAPLRNFNDGGGGVRQRFIIYTQKNHNFRICLPKKITTFLAYPKKSCCPFFTTQKNPGIFHRPKKNHFCQKFQTQKNHSDSPPLSLKYVSGASQGFSLSLIITLHLSWVSGNNSVRAYPNGVALYGYSCHVLM